MPDGGALVEDSRSSAGREHYLVRPPGSANGAAVLYLHWFDEAPNANRSQYLEEAKQLAELGVVSLLPQLAFPWHSAPSDIDSDLTRIRAEVEYLSAAYQLLAGAEDVDSTRIGVVGHDFGAMYGMLLLGVFEPGCAVLVAATPRWADWFLRFWPVDSDRFDYMRSLHEVDPITVLEVAKCPLLFQFGKQDFYIAAMTGLELYEAAPDPKRMLSYDTGHEMDGDEIMTDRVGFLSERLGFTI
ncbi:MAG: hypothetical protein WBM90_08900 [Acidimicrobiia bacterium]